MLNDYMQKIDMNIESVKSLKHNVSPKLQELMNLLLNIKPTDSCLVFVDRRSTAKILYHYIKVYFKIYSLICFFFLIFLIDFLIDFRSCKQTRKY